MILAPATETHLVGDHVNDADDDLQRQSSSHHHNHDYSNEKSRRVRGTEAQKDDCQDDVPYHIFSYMRKFYQPPGVFKASVFTALSTTLQTFGTPRDIVYTAKGVDV